MTYSTDPALYLFTSLTAGSSHIVTATSRLQTILRANRVPYKAIDVATDDKARILWGRRAGKDDGGRMRKLPGLVQDGLVLGDLVEVEDWNEFGELKQHVNIYYDQHTTPTIHDKPPDPKLRQPPAPAAPASEAAEPASKARDEHKTESALPAALPAALPMRGVGAEAAQKAKELRLKNLREKVHGEPTDPDAAEPLTPKITTAADDEPETEPGPCATHVAAGLQSPTSGAWKDSPRDHLPAARQTIQSPTTGRWHYGSDDVIGSASHVVQATEAEITEAESQTVIKERPEMDTGEEQQEPADKQRDGADKGHSCEEQEERADKQHDEADEEHGSGNGLGEGPGQDVDHQQTSRGEAAASG